MNDSRELPKGKKGRPKGCKRTKEQIAADQNFCAKLFLRGYTFREMANELNRHNESTGVGYSITHTQVHYDMSQLMIQWKKERLEDMNEYMTLQISQLDMMYRECWDAWEKSKNGRLKVKVRNNAKPIKSDNADGGSDYYGFDENTTETTHGDPRYMQMMLDIMQRKAKLLGIDEPIKIHITKPDEKIAAIAYDVKAIPENLLVALADSMQGAKFDKIKAEGE